MNLPRALNFRHYQTRQESTLRRHPLACPCPAPTACLDCLPRLPACLPLLLQLLLLLLLAYQRNVLPPQMQMKTPAKALHLSQHKECTTAGTLPQTTPSPFLSARLPCQPNLPRLVPVSGILCSLCIVFYVLAYAKMHTCTL